MGDFFCDKLVADNDREILLPNVRKDDEFVQALIGFLKTRYCVVRSEQINVVGCEFSACRLIGYNKKN